MIKIHIKAILRELKRRFEKRKPMDWFTESLMGAAVIVLVVIAVMACIHSCIEQRALGETVCTCITRPSMEATTQVTAPTVLVEPSTAAPTETEPTIRPTDKPTIATTPTQPQATEPTWQPNEEDVVAIARTIWGEARGVASKSEQAAVAWCILNRLDSGRFGSTVRRIVSAPNQFAGYSSSFPVTDEFRALAIDVLQRWHAEKEGNTNVGRTLPNDYYFFSGSNGRNYFRKEYKSGEYWDWSLKSPYES